jgi:hypothetical protein
VYSWIWRHLPFGRPGKIIGSLALTAAIGALLWYVVFPQAEQLLPFYDVQVTDQGGGGQGAVAPTAGSPAASTSPGARPGASAGSPSLGEHDIPYPTTRNNSAPATKSASASASASPSR